MSFLQPTHKMMPLENLAKHLDIQESAVLKLIDLGLLPPAVAALPDGQQRWVWENVRPYVDGHVYFIEANHLIKIGFSRNLKSRVKMILDGLPCEGRFLHSIIGTERLEKFMHKKFAHIRKHGEWFQKTDELIFYIASVGRGPLGGSP